MDTLSEPQLRALLLQFRQGDEPAFNQLYSTYAKVLYRKINSIVKDDDVAEELLQDLFLKIWDKRRLINIDHSFVAFLYTVAQNLVYDYLRKVSRDKRLQATLLINAVDYYMQTEEALIGKETAAIIQQAIDKLSESRKKVFILCKMEGKTYQQAADELGISIATVNSHMVKSISFIKEYLHKNPEIGLLLIFGVILC
ncbi:RNA polymerase subunit sigma-70 [Pedobacter sp. HMWF019]|uniref:RNA polymerase sigma factor n=1 Tax=Pedobacter sp. HMWF019 TaxID=2056856 RepID=UPI000D36B9FB|nr:RNA polymerase sigma-70 factor [Pedobacter sp. HMWF019]PTT00787.1 RNA polymerase subunit sigma-70 [Pedobacter sp. HMWF019]